MSLLVGAHRPEKKFMMLDDFSLRIVKEALNCSACCFESKAMKAIRKGNHFLCRMHVQQHDYVNNLLYKLKEKEFYFIGTLAKGEKIIVKDSLADYKDGLRDCAVDFKLGFETEGNKKSSDAYIVLGKLIESINTC